VSGFVTLLLAYHFAHLWIVTETGKAKQKLPTAYQYYLTMSLINGSKLTALFDTVQYMFTSRSRRRSLTPVLLLAFLSAFLVVALCWVTKGLDLVLHDRIVPTTMWNNFPLLNFPSDAAITPGCDDSTRLLCPVSARAVTGRTGGLNQSEDFRVYPHLDLSAGNLSFIAPPSLLINQTVEKAHTYAAATACQAYHPRCNVSNDHILECHVDPSYAIANTTTYGPVRFDTSGNLWEMRLFLLNRGSVDVNATLLMSNGANVNPLPFVSFGCFGDYANITYNDSDSAPFKTPFFNWWTRVLGGVPNNPLKLCSITYCNTTFYDATYSTLANSFALDAGSLELANESATIALSGAAYHIGDGEGNSQFYIYGANYLDEMLQVDLSTVGNLYGNDTDAFAAAWGSSISNRLLGWSAGTINLRPGKGKVKQQYGELALSIDLVSAYAFIGVHMLLAGIIILLGVSCAFIPRSTPLSSGRSAPVSDIRAAHAKLSNFSTLMVEVLDARDAGVQQSATAHSLKDLHGSSAERPVRLGLRARENGGIGLDFHE
jgi:hypothetical protein